LSELGVIGRPALVVPLPHSLEGDQLHNARAFETAGGGWLVEQANLTPAHLATWLTEAMAQPDRLAAAARASAGFGRPDAVARLADLIETLVRGRAAGQTGSDNQTPGRRSAADGLHFEVAQ